MWGFMACEMHDAVGSMYFAWFVGSSISMQLDAWGCPWPILQRAVGGGLCLVSSGFRAVRCERRRRWGRCSLLWWWWWWCWWWWWWRRRRRRWRLWWRLWWREWWWGGRNMMNKNEEGRKQPAAFAGKLMFVERFMTIHASCDIWQLHQNDKILRKWKMETFHIISITTHVHDFHVLHQFLAGNSSLNMGPWHFYGSLSLIFTLSMSVQPWKIRLPPDGRRCGEPRTPCQEMARNHPLHQSLLKILRRGG